jgi:Zn-dependent protease with chaperone function
VDFFRAQDQARSNTWKLLLLFMAAVAGIIFAVYLLLYGLQAFDALDAGRKLPRFWDPAPLASTALVVGLLIGVGSLYKIIALSRGGGAAVAASLGGQLVSRGTQDPLEQRLLNVVDEMAIASGMTVPQVFVLADEPGINAFAAGTKPSKAVLAVTQGALEHLSREGLQGVVAHEFSHIFNGDMRTNIRLSGLLHGILLLAMLGRTLLDGAASSNRSPAARHSDKNEAGVTLVLLGVGFGLLLVGYIGVFFGQLIKAAVSRQREYLADASAVQFTRNPLGLAGALKQIVAASSQVRHPNSEAASHMFFGEGISAVSNMLATHPPIGERIHRLDPTYSPNTAVLAQIAKVKEEEAAATANALIAAERSRVSPRQVRDSVGNPNSVHAIYIRQMLGDCPDAVLADINNPAQVALLLYGMLVANAADPAKNLGAVLKDLDTLHTERVLAHAAWVKSVGPSTQLPLIELATPALQELPQDAQARVLQHVEALVQADNQLTLLELTLTALLRQALVAPASTKSTLSAGYDTPAIRKDVAELLAQLARAGHKKSATAASAFDDAARQAPIDQLGAYTDAIQLDLPLDLHRFDALLGRLGGLTYAFRGQLIEACVAAISSDGKVVLSEAEMLRAIGARLDCPVPPLLPGSD